MKNYNFNIKHIDICPKCKSKDISKRFSNVEDTEDYNLHYDTLKCNACGYWDFPDAFTSMVMESDNSEICPKCCNVGKVKLDYYDYYSGDIELKCECGHVDNIENFVGKDRWEAFLEEERKIREAEIERNVKFFMDYYEE